ncbi:MAG: hypothetical protein K2X47_11020, partial [Bdellovibrionales bacterium]|nr:hypothetical protein [Bdellovibrionales bacterium]
FISPKPQAEVQVAVDGSEKTLWEWKKDIEPNFVISLDLGKSRSQLKPFTDFSRDGKKLLASLKPGDHYWRLNATDPANPAANMSSQIYKIKVLPKRPPLAVAPGRDQEVPFTESPQKIVFKWVNPGKLHHIAIELAESEDFSRGKVSYLVNEKESFEGKLQKAGVYYWRLSGQTGKEGTVLTSPTMKFVAQDGKTARSPTALEEKSAVAKLPTINMKSLDPILKHQYLTPKPEMFVEWLPGPPTAKTYQVSFRQEKEKFGEPLKVTETSARTPLPKDGRWIVKIDALDANGKLVAEGLEKPIDIEAAPLLPAPRYDQALANPITSSKRGEMSISWLPVSGAKQYQITLKDNDGNTIQEQTITENQIAFKKLKPGEFNVTVWALDQQARRGIASERRRAVVPKTSDVGAPKVKIKVQ